VEVNLSRRRFRRQSGAGRALSRGITTADALRCWIAVIAGRPLGRRDYAIIITLAASGLVCA